MDNENLYNDGEITVAADGITILNADKRFLEFSGYSDDEIKNISFSKLITLPNDDNTVYCLRCSSGYMTEVVFKRVNNDDGSFIVHLCSLSRLESLRDKYAEKEVQWDTILCNIPCAVAIYEVGEEISLLYASDDYYSQIGFTKDEYMKITGGIVGNLIYPKDKNKIFNAMRDCTKHDGILRIQFRMYGKNKKVHYISCRAKVYKYNNGNPVIFATLMDITEQKHNEYTVNIQNERFNLISEYTNDIMFDYDVERDSISFSGNYKIFSKFDTVDHYLETFHFKSRVHPDDLPRMMSKLGEMLDIPQKTHIDIRLDFNMNEHYTWYRVPAVSFGEEQNEVTHIFGRIYDIDEEKLLEHKLNNDKELIERLSTTDPITGLYNRKTFKSKTAERINSSAENKKFAIVYTDINGFSYINDNHGYEAGNKMLFDYGQILLELPCCVFSSRIYSDYYVSLFEGSSEDEIIKGIESGTQEFTETQHTKFPASNVSLSTGIYFVNGYCDITVDMDNANLARRKAKEIKEHRYYIYNDRLRFQRSKEKSITSELHSAIQNHHIELFLQPKFDLDTRNTIGAEALVRWKNDDGSYRMPADFISILETAGYIVELDFFIFREVLKTLRRWMDEGKKLFPISVNFSRVHSNYDDFVKRICDLTDSYGVDRKYIEIEVTESAFASDLDKMMANMSRLQSYGFKTDIDDFGIGYSSLSFLMESPIDTVKVDKVFVDNIVINDRQREYIKQMCMLIKTTDKDIIFEGVETEEQAKFLSSCGFRKAQGWLYDKAVPVDEFEAKYVL